MPPMQQQVTGIKTLGELMECLEKVDRHYYLQSKKTIWAQYLANLITLVEVVFGLFYTHETLHCLLPPY